jgi:hypothetical protein
MFVVLLYLNVTCCVTLISNHHVLQDFSVAWAFVIKKRLSFVTLISLLRPFFAFAVLLLIGSNIFLLLPPPPLPHCSGQLYGGEGTTK